MGVLGEVGDVLGIVQKAIEKDFPNTTGQVIYVEDDAETLVADGLGSLRKALQVVNYAEQAGVVEHDFYTGNVSGALSSLSAYAAEDAASYLGDAFGGPAGAMAASAAVGKIIEYGREGAINYVDNHFFNTSSPTFTVSDQLVS
jgi:hypothetical protein